MQNRLTKKDLEEKAEELRRATGLPYYIKRKGVYAHLFVTINQEGVATFGEKATEDVAIMSPTSLAECIERRIEGVQLGFEVLKKVHAHFINNRPPEIKTGVTMPTFDRAEFCPDCGALVFGRGDGLMFDVRERHWGETGHHS
jgi:hypothetical protein